MSSIQQYRVFNRWLGLALSIVFIYPLLFSKLDKQQQIFCAHKVYLGKACNSCGVTHDFKHILNGKYFKDQTLQNNHSIPVFLFFVSAFLARFLISFLIQRYRLRLVLMLDVAWHCGLGLYAFSGFWL